MVLHILVIDKGNELNIYKPFRQCTLKDFTSRNYTEYEESDLGNMLCPDVPNNYSMFRLESKYTNKTFRQSFSVDVLKCNLEVNPDCKNETEQQRFFESFYWTFEILESMV